MLKTNIKETFLKLKKKKKQHKIWFEKAYCVSENSDPKWPTNAIKVLDLKEKEKMLWTFQQKEQVVYKGN